MILNYSEEEMLKNSITTQSQAPKTTVETKGNWEPAAAGLPGS
jgi:hypothetical protein